MTDFDLDRNPLRALGDGGVGYCYLADRDLFRGGGHLQDGPLLVALDSNIIIDLEQYGADLIDEVGLSGVDPATERDLYGLGSLLNLWMMRDIRFIVLPQTRDDYRRAPSKERLREREQLFGRIESALTYQAGDWGSEQDRFIGGRSTDSAVDALLDAAPSSLDGLMLRSAWSAAVDVFVTRDIRLLSSCAGAPFPFPLVLSPADLVERLELLPGQELFQGVVDHVGCEYSGGLPFGDSGKWVPLFEALS